jgi:hypothetical protein
MSVALHGNLRDFGVAEVFQLIGQQRKTGILVVEGKDDGIFLTFDEGRVVRGGPGSPHGDREPLGPQLVRAGYLTRDQLDDLQAESERSARPLSDLLLATGRLDPEALEEVQHLLTKETVFEVMRRQSGDFNFSAEAVVHDTKPEYLLGVEQILMDGLRMLDEWRTFESIVPSQGLVFARAGNLEAAREMTKGGGDDRLGNTERVLQLVDGRLSVRRIVDLSRIGVFEATRALAELRQAGVIDVAGPAASKRAPVGDRSAPRRPVLPILRAALATVLPFVALGFFGSEVVERADLTGGLAGSAIPMLELDHFGARYENDLIRSELEIHLYEHGRYPASLEELASPGHGRLASLTTSRLADYYYVVRGDEVVLLAPVDSYGATKLID